MDSYRILWFDPGETSGWGKCDYRKGMWSFKCGSLGPAPHHMKTWKLISAVHDGVYGKDVEFMLGTESFEWRYNPERSGLELVSKEYIGVYRLYAEYHHLVLKEQTASVGKVSLPKSFVKRTNLQRLGLWISGREHRHEMDAYGHILQYIILNKLPGRTDLLQRGWKR